MQKGDMRAGFTLIEILVVISIIAVLASVLLSRFNTVRAKAVDANIRSNMSLLTEAGESYELDNNTYLNVCNEANFVRSLEAASMQSTSFTTDYRCYDSTHGWAAAVSLKVQNQFSTTSATDYWCVEARTEGRLYDNNLAVSSTTCS